MIKNQKNLKIRVLFNASVVLSGLRSPGGGSGELLRLIKLEKIEGEISEVIQDEILRHYKKLGLLKLKVEKDLKKLFPNLILSPNKKTVEKYKKVVIDEGDSHVLATCDREKIKYLVTLDKKHLLILKGKIKGLHIFTPGEFIEFLSKKSPK